MRGRTNNRGARTLLWAAGAACLFGAIDLGEPVERVFGALRNAARAHDADGSVVVVAVDNATLRALPDWSSRRATTATAIDELLKAGATRVFVNKVFSDPSATGDDATLATVLERYPGRVVLGARVDHDPVTAQTDVVTPTEELRSKAVLGATNIWSDGMNYSTRVALGFTINGVHYPSFSAIAADLPETTGMFSPDYSIRPSSVPTVSFADVVRGGAALTRVRGREVMLGPTSQTLGDIHTVPGHGGVPGVMVHAIAAETLKSGIPREIGWIPGCVVALLAMMRYFRAKSARARALWLAGGAAAITVGPLLLDSIGYQSQVVPATVLLLVAVVRDKIVRHIISNPLTGLPTLDRVVNKYRAEDTTLIGMKIANYGDLRANLAGSEEGELLQEIIRRLKLGGAQGLMHCDDGFVWTSDMPASTELTNHLEGLHAVLMKPIPVGSRLVDITVGFGIEGVRDRPLKNRVGSVQVAAVEAIGGGLRWKMHDPRNIEDADFRLSLMSRIDSAIERGELWVAYQPKLDLRTMRVTGAEALVRWTHPERGMIPPDRFIPAAEQANRIAGITYFVLNRALADLKQLETVDRNLTIAVNVSARMLAERNFPETVEDYLRRHGIWPHRLTIEITETAELDPEGTYLTVLNELRALGVKISIDDYGTKNSTLDYLRQLPATEVKIDQRFIRTLHEDEDARIMARSTIELAHSLGLTVVAEGVEFEETKQALSRMGCDVLQGYLIAKPLRLPDMERFLTNIIAVKAAL